MSGLKNNKEEAPTISRRGFLKFAGASGAMALAGIGNIGIARASGPAPMGVLVDTTLCVGCRACEGACNEANKLPKPAVAFDDDSVLENIRDTSPAAFTVVNRYTAASGEQVTRKQQCMHCLEPACSSACIIKAMEKQPSGPVTYRDDLCLGCRYCMVACPFNVPKFEYDSATPLIRKCQFCFARQEQGKEPACTEACPSGALTFGRRADLLEEAKKRIYTQPGSYVHHVYGEHEAGGTSWLYLANTPFETLGLPALDGKAYPELTAGAMSAVPMVMLLWPALLMGFRHLSGGKDDVHREHSKLHISRREGDHE